MLSNPLIIVVSTMIMIMKITIMTITPTMATMILVMNFTTNEIIMNMIMVIIKMVIIIIITANKGKNMYPEMMTIKLAVIDKRSKTNKNNESSYYL